MAIRKTESRIPANFQASDLGQAIVAADGRCALVSFLTSPFVVFRENHYVLFLTDAAFAAAAQSFEWTFIENSGTPSTETTQAGEISYQPQAAGALDLKVRVLDTGNNEQANLTLTQNVGTPNPVLEGLISKASREPGPGLANPDVVRELVNDYCFYYQAVSQQSSEGDAFRHFLFSVAFDGVLQRTPSERNQHLDNLALALNGEGTDFSSLLLQGVGVCGIRLPLLAMIAGISGGSAPLLDWTELPDIPDKRAVAEEQLCQSVALLSEEVRIDLFNVARFPKSNFAACGKILLSLRDRYFPGTNFNDVLTGMSGTRAQWIVRHYREGPLLRT